MTWGLAIMDLVGKLAPLAFRWFTAAREDRAAIEAEGDAALAEWAQVRREARAIDDAIAAEVDALLAGAAPKDPAGTP